MQFEMQIQPQIPHTMGLVAIGGALAGCDPKQVLALKASCFSRMVVVFRAAVQVLDHLLVTVWEPGCEFGSIHVHAACLHPGLQLDEVSSCLPQASEFVTTLQLRVPCLKVQTYFLANRC